MKKVLERDSDNGYMGGVCSGLATYTNTSALGWRVLFLFCLGPIPYIALWLMLRNKK